VTTGKPVIHRPGWVERATPEGATGPAVRGSSGTPHRARHRRTCGTSGRLGLKLQHIGLLPSSVAFAPTLTSGARCLRGPSARRR
jgi:hypothetical protein